LPQRKRLEIRWGHVDKLHVNQKRVHALGKTSLSTHLKKKEKVNLGEKRKNQTNRGWEASVNKEGQRKLGI